LCFLLLLRCEDCGTQRPYAEMRAGRKNLKRDALDGIPEPELGHVLMRVVGLRGSNVIEAENSAGENTLCLLPAKFSKTIWVKTGSFIFVDEADRERAIESGSKVTGTISRVLLDDQVRGLRKTSSWWPEYFDKAPERIVDKVEEQEEDRNEQHEGGDEEEEESDDDGLPPLEANSNRHRSIAREDSTESDSDEEETLVVGKN